MRYVTEPTPGSPADLQDEADPEQVARTILLRRLSVAPRTRKELADDLRKRGLPDDVSERVLDRFTEVGLIDDAEYARMWADSRRRTKGSARSVLLQELRTKGVSDEDARAAVEQIDDESERARALSLVMGKLASTSRFDVPTRRRRLVSMLMRRGYRQAVALSVVDEAIAGDVHENGAESDDSMSPEDSI